MGVYLAMTQAELQSCAALPENYAWMACHFSSADSGLSNIPSQLPPHGLLCIDDSLLPSGHDRNRIAQQISKLCSRFSANGIILDFQKPFLPELYDIAQEILHTAPCPTAVTPQYIQNWDGAVFLPPVPLNQPVAEYASPWNGREIWLEISTEGLCMALTEEGCICRQGEYCLQTPVFQDKTLHCQYSIRLANDTAEFILHRSWQDITALLEDGKQYGITHGVGLYQEFRSICPHSHIQWDRPKYKEAGYE